MEYLIYHFYNTIRSQQFSLIFKTMIYWQTHESSLLLVAAPTHYLRLSKTILVVLTLWDLSLPCNYLSLRFCNGKTTIIMMFFFISYQFPNANMLFSKYLWNICNINFSIKTNEHEDCWGAWSHKLVVCVPLCVPVFC